MIFIPVEDAAVDKILPISGNTPGGCVFLVGAPGAAVVTLKQPAVADPQEDTPSDWMDIIVEGATQVLSATNTIIAIPYRVPLLVSKPAGAAFGVGIK